MKRFVLAFAYAAMVWLGCAPLKQYQCRAGTSGATEYHTVEASSLDEARNGGGFGECRSAAAIEQVVNEEYASFTAFDDATFTCEAFAEYHTDTSGTRAAIRRKWTVTYKLLARDYHHGVPVPRYYVLVFYSGDEQLDGRYQANAPMYSRVPSRAVTLEAMANQPGTIVREKARSFRVEVPIAVLLRDGPLLSDEVCWRNGDTPPDRAWLRKSTTSNTFCRQWDRALASFGAIPMSTKDTGLTRYDCSMSLSYRQFVETSDGKELGAQQTITRTENGLCGPKTNAQSSIEAALRHSVGSNAHHGEFAGNCAESH